MNACYTVLSDYLTRPKLLSFRLLDGLSLHRHRPAYEKPRDFGLERLATAFMNSLGYSPLVNSRSLFVEPCCGPLPAPE